MVHELLIAAARQVEHLLPVSASFVIQTSLDDFYVSYPLNAYIREASRQPLFTLVCTSTFKNEFNAAGVKIMSPYYLAAHAGNYTIPADYLSDY